ncbi:DUF2079 domain-containing protein [Streptomyces sp. NRRL S-1448]|uniref:DUF2079 domain-containing protein n=1 Tax=Streptomyces sp. NRRL S-1448 TaxID=1463883 RepID=UPI001F28BDD0|nr:DUF2079 domain-containing protein [Streptomyces sp. NRRL S-1448]
MTTDALVEAGPVSYSRRRWRLSAASFRNGAVRWRLIVLALLCFSVTCGLGLQLWSTVGLGGFDLGIFDQGIRSYAHLQLPHSPIKNYHHEFPPGFSLLGDHFSPILALLAPLYWVWDDPRVLILAQSALFAAGVPFIWRIAERCFTHADTCTKGRAAGLVALVYALGWPLLVAARNGFHEVAFAVPLTLILLERGLARSYGATFLAAVLLCLTKEDLGLVVGFYGAVLLWRHRREKDLRSRLTGSALLVCGPLLSMLAIGVLVPAMGGPRGYYWSYGQLADSFGGLAVRAVTDPLALFTAAFSTPVKAGLMLWLLGTLLFLPLGSATSLCVVPLVAERVLSENPNHWSLIHHYDAFVWPILLTASVETAARLHRVALKKGPAFRRAVVVSGIAATALSTAIACFFGLVTLFSLHHWTPSAVDRQLVAAAAHVPDGATVEADNNVVPRLTSRTQVVILDGHPRGADYVVLQNSELTFPFTTTAQLQQRQQLLLAHGYRLIWSQGSTVVLHRTDKRIPVPGTRIPGPHSTPVKDVPATDLGRNLFTG